MTTPNRLNAPIDYTSKDYASFVDLMSTDALTKLPEWTSRSQNDFGMVLIEEFAYLGDILSVYTDRIANEAYLPTATLRSSILNLAYLLDYRPDTGQAAIVSLRIGVQAGTGSVLIPRKSQFASTGDSSALQVIFETDVDLFIQQDAASIQYGIVNATEGTSVLNEQLGPSTGLPSQQFSLLQSPVIDTSVEIYVSERGPSDIAQWTFVEHLIDAGPEDQVYTTRLLANDVLTVLFGDGINGRVPYVGANITSTYRVGGGTAGNVGAGTITAIVCAPTTVINVFNQGPAQGGTDPETNDQIRINAPRSMRTVNRAVTLQDYADLALRVAGVAKAKASGYSDNNITVYLAPLGGGTATPTLKSRVSAYYLGKTRLGAKVTLANPVYAPLNIGVEIIVLNNYIRGVVATLVQNALQSLLAFDNVDFAQSVSVSDVYRAVVAVPGVGAVNVTTLDRASAPSPGVDTVDLDTNEIPIVAGSMFNVVILSGGVQYATGGPGESGTEPPIPDAPGAPTITSITCGTGNSFTMGLNWTGVSNATHYRVLMSFYMGTVYKGTLDSGYSFSTTSGSVNGVFAGADTIQVVIRAVNGGNFTDSPITSDAYPCG